MNEVTQNCQMDVLIRYLDEDDVQVKVRCLDSSFLGHSTNVDLLEQFTNVVNELNPNRILQISMDGPSVNLNKKFKIIGKQMSSFCLLTSVVVDYTPWHFKAGVQSTDWMLKEVLNSAYHILHDSPA